MKCSEDDCDEVLGLRNKSGLCRRHMQADYARKKRASDPDGVRAYHRARYAADPERGRAASNAWAARNREQIAAKNRERYAADPEAAKARARAAYDANPERAAATSRAWVESNRAAKYAANARYEARKLKNFVEDVDRLTVWLRDRGICHLCLDFADVDWELEHVIPLALGGPHCYANVAVACKPCNGRKHAKAYSADPKRWSEAVASFQMHHQKPFDSAA